MTPTRPAPIWLAKPDALGFAAGEGLGATGQAQIVEGHVDQKTEPLDDLFEDLVRPIWARWPVSASPRRPAHRRWIVRRWREFAVIDELRDAPPPANGCPPQLVQGLVGDVFGRALRVPSWIRFPGMALHVVRQDPSKGACAPPHHHGRHAAGTRSRFCPSPAAILPAPWRADPQGAQIELMVLGEDFSIWK